MSRPKVINIKDAPQGWETNPEYVLVDYIPNNVEFDLTSQAPLDEQYVEYYKEYVRGTPQLLSKVRALRGLTLIVLTDQRPCHADVLAQVCEELNQEGLIPEDAGATYTGIEDYDPFADMN